MEVKMEVKKEVKKEVKMDNSNTARQYPKLSSSTTCFTSSQQRWLYFLFNFIL